jgi:hypothetical protein
MPDQKPAFRLAMRSEGKWWVCYYAKPDTMVGAIALARVRLHLVEAAPEIKTSFINFCTAVMNIAAKEVVGAGITEWKTESAPESEKSGNA